MKVPLPITCPACGEKFTQEINARNLPKYFRCPKCGVQPYHVWPLGNIVARLLMERAKQEFANSDITVAILLFAIAVECEMSYLFFKWKGIDSGKVLAHRTVSDRQLWEKEWGSMRSIGKRLDKLSRLLTNMCFDQFASQNKQLLVPALSMFDPSTSIRDHFQDQLFERRNRIAHYGEVDFGKLDGEQCFSTALSLISLLHAMDQERIKRMDEDHKRASQQGTC
ncbi:MAG: hypothetical protein ABSG07_10335 [Terriglobales bacterium]|jgi:hypothetical protein